MVRVGLCNIARCRIASRLHIAFGQPINIGGEFTLELDKAGVGQTGIRAPEKVWHGGANILSRVANDDSNDY